MSWYAVTSFTRRTIKKGLATIFDDFHWNHMLIFTKKICKGTSTIPHFSKQAILLYNIFLNMCHDRTLAQFDIYLYLSCISISPNPLFYVEKIFQKKFCCLVFYLAFDASIFSNFIWRKNRGMRAFEFRRGIQGNPHMYEVHLFLISIRR